MQRFKIEYVIWINIVYFSIIVSFQLNLKELMLPYQLLKAPLFEHCMTKSTHFHLLTPSPFISSGKIANPLFLISPPTIRGRRVQDNKSPSLFRKNSQSTSYRLRNTSTDLKLAKNNTENGKKSFSFRGAKLWNSLSANCKQAATLSTFKQYIL